MRLVWSVAVLIVLGSAAQAQGAATQQCVWSCLAASSGASDPRYHQCVNARCAGLEKAPAARTRSVAPRQPSRPRTVRANSGNPTQVWQMGQQDGTVFAGIDAPGWEGQRGVYLFCHPGVGPRVAAIGVEGRPAQMRLVIDGRAFLRNMRVGPSGWPEGGIGERGPMNRALRQGSRFELQQADGRVVFRLSLRGSNDAISQFFSRC